LAIRDLEAKEASKLVAAGEQPGPEHDVSQCLLRLFGTSTPVCRIAQPAEPPYADPHVRWCGRGERATAPPMPIGHIMNCHPERSEGPLHSFAATKLHRSFASLRMTG